MQVKSFSARSSKEILRRIKEELGPEAVILDSREAGGVITMTAATERNPAPPRPVNRQGRAQDQTGQEQSGLPLPGFEPIGGRPARYRPFPVEEPAKAPRPLSAAAAKDLPLTPGDDAAKQPISGAPDAKELAAYSFRAAQARTRAGQKSVAIPAPEAVQHPQNARRGGQNRPAQATEPELADKTPPIDHTAHGARRATPATADFAGRQKGRPQGGGGAGHDRRNAMYGADAPPDRQRRHQEWSEFDNRITALSRPFPRLDKLPPKQRLAIEFLQSEGVEDEAMLGLYQRLQKDPMVSILTPLSKMVPVRRLSMEYWPQRIQAIAGPFGAGKTSVAIRMALSLRKSDPGCRICLVNADATRGTGRLLLRHYCELSDLAYKEASTTMELVSALNAALRENFDRILVDLPGLSRGRFLSVLLADAGLGERTGEKHDDLAVHLALPPHYGSAQLYGLLKRYSSAHAGSIIWTKLDEADHYGQIVNAAVESGLPVSALSFGPGLGNSLVPAKENMLWRLLFKRELPFGH